MFQLNCLFNWSKSLTGIPPRHAESEVMMVGDNRKYNVALVTLTAEGATGELPGTDKLAGVALEAWSRHVPRRCMLGRWFWLVG